MGLVCRVVEESGIATVCVSTGRDLIELVKPPRSLFVNHPMGNAFGAPGDVEMQLAVLRAALEMVDSASAGELRDLPTAWSRDFKFAPAASRM